MTSSYSSYGHPSSFSGPSASFIPPAPAKDGLEEFLPFSLASFWLPMSPRVQKHLYNVYSTLLLTAISAATGAAFHMRYGVGGMITQLLSALLIVVIGTHRGDSSYSSSSSSGVWPSRVYMLLGLGFLQGCSIGPLIDYAFYIDSSLIVTAALLTANIFLCLSLTALYIPRRSTFTFAALLSSGVSFLCLMSLVSLFFPSVWMFSLQLWLGLVIFSGYILFDTQVMIERAEKTGATAGDAYVDDALKLFTNLIAIFVRILIILIQQSQKGKEEDRRRRRR